MWDCHVDAGKGQTVVTRYRTLLSKTSLYAIVDVLIGPLGQVKLILSLFGSGEHPVGPLPHESMSNK